MFTLLLSAGLAASAPATTMPTAPAPIVTLVPRPPTAVLPPIDLARLALARTTANALFRDGTVARMLDRMLSFGPAMPRRSWT